MRVTGREGFVRRQRLIVSAPEFFDTYAPRFFRFVMRRASDQDLAEEITQTTLIAAAGKLKTWSRWSRRSGCAGGSNGSPAWPVVREAVRSVLRD